MNRTSLAALAVAGALVVATPAFASTQTSTPSTPATTTVTVTPTVTTTVTPTVEATTTTNTAPTDPAMALSAGDTSNVSTPALVLFIMGILTTVLAVIEKLPLDKILPKR